MIAFLQKSTWLTKRRIMQQEDTLCSSLCSNRKDISKSRWPNNAAWQDLVGIHQYHKHGRMASFIWSILYIIFEYINWSLRRWNDEKAIFQLRNSKTYIWKRKWVFRNFFLKRLNFINEQFLHKKCKELLRNVQTKVKW
jgi:hypothetical protein